MTYELLIARIQERLSDLNLSERKACLKAGLHVDAIRSIRNGHAPRIERLAALAKVLEVPVDFFTSAVNGGDHGTSAPPVPALTTALTRVAVRGYVQAGKWREAIEWPADTWYGVTVPAHPKYADAERFALEVRGNSMNKLYPERTILICVRFFDIARPPKPGDKVICLRRDRYGEFEATVKEYQRDEQGRHILWPRSDDPEHQAPIVLSDGLPVATDQHALPSRVNAGPFSQAGVDDIIIAALVIQSVREEE
ncbi:LexA family transcriptional regulator [Niveispirillum sp.]|uniref:LexA family transcriptional regulator n=1 Tax=Niveispirillum sp. TaxID=1917217 RepID=UPI001B791AA3|nr:LexA family transcriptional regulator [Niveispirillum sp.]MBP7336896.1 helix-turn-helix domain-containing protein [Niveispirillum sp.]